MEPIAKFIECLVPATVCNLNCDYCYISQKDISKDQLPSFQYSAEHIGKALSRERLKGTCFISICGAGETLIPKEITDVVFRILEEGHYVNITTNGTITKRFNEIVQFPRDLLSRLHFSFSFHYLELLRTNHLETFFSNINTVRNAGCSFMVQFNLYDKYIPHLETIKNICVEHVGAAPQIAATRKQGEQIELLTVHTKQEYHNLGSDFESPLFDFTLQNFMVKRRDFCYAGDWSFVLNLSTGIAKRCYSDSNIQNIFQCIDHPIKFKAVGNACRSTYCVNSSHFMSWGVIPTIKTPTYTELRNRKCDNGSEWIHPKMKAFMSQKLADNNDEYNTTEKIQVNLLHHLHFPQKACRKVVAKIKSMVKK